MTKTFSLIKKYNDPRTKNENIINTKIKTAKIVFHDYFRSFNLNLENNNLSLENAFSSANPTAIFLYEWFKNNDAQYIIEFEDNIKPSDLMFLYNLLKNEYNIIISTSHLFLIVNELKKEIVEKLMEKYPRMIINKSAANFNLPRFYKILFKKYFHTNLSESNLFFIWRRVSSNLFVSDEKAKKELTNNFFNFSKAEEENNQTLLLECFDIYQKYYEQWVNELITNPKIWIGFVCPVFNKSWNNYRLIYLYDQTFGLISTYEELKNRNSINLFKNRQAIFDFFQEWSKTHGKL